MEEKDAGSFFRRMILLFLLYGTKISFSRGIAGIFLSSLPRKISATFLYPPSGLPAYIKEIEPPLPIQSL